MSKKILITLISWLATFAGFASIWQVDNNSNNPGVYSTIQTAQDAASAGDTLYIHGSPTQYSGGTINKPLVIIGEGALPNKIYKYKSDIYALTFGFNQNYTSNASGSKLFGCSINTIYLASGGGSGNIPVNNITIQRNYVSILYFSAGNGGNTGHSGIIISNNIIQQLGYGSTGLIENSIFRNNIVGDIVNLGNATAGSWTFSNNLIYSGFSGCSSALVSNNIFYKVSAGAAVSGLNYCTISNNLFFQADGTATPYTNSSIISGTNSGSNNVLNLDPLFVQFPISNYINFNSYSYTYPAETDPPVNFHLRPGSPCIGTGSDGLEMGIYGGQIPYFEGTPNSSRFTYFPMPAIPAVLDMNIQNSSVLPNGTLNVQFIGRKQD